MTNDYGKTTGRGTATKGRQRYTGALSPAMQEIIDRYANKSIRHSAVSTVAGDIVEAYLQNAYSSTSDNDKAVRDEIRTIVLMIRYYATLFRLPIWKMIHALLVEGFIGWFKRNEHIIRAAVEREKRAADAAQKMFEVEKADADIRDAWLDEMAQRVTNEMEYRNLGTIQGKRVAESGAEYDTDRSS